MVKPVIVDDPWVERDKFSGMVICVRITLRSFEEHMANVPRSWDIATVSTSGVVSDSPKLSSPELVELLNSVEPPDNTKTPVIVLVSKVDWPVLLKLLLSPRVALDLTDGSLRDGSSIEELYAAVEKVILWRVQLPEAKP